MKFYDRINELETMTRIGQQSAETMYFTIMVERIRIGKTSLIYYSKNNFVKNLPRKKILPQSAIFGTKAL